MTSSIPPAADPGSATPSDRLWLRSELMGTQVITRDTGRRLGVVGEVVVDIDRREVVALGLRDNPLTRFLPGLPRWMPLDRIRQVGDVILVDSADSLVEAFNPERYSKVINCQVITEAGNVLGRVLGFSFDIETGELASLVIGALGVPLLGEGVLSTWELSVQELVSSGPDRIIVYEGADEKLKQLSSGLLEKLGIGGSSWEQEERDRFRSTMVPVENQLAAGQAATSEQRRIQPATSNRVMEPEAELDYVEVERRAQEPLRQRRYLDEDDERYDRDGYGGNRGGSGRFESGQIEPGQFQARQFQARQFESGGQFESGPFDSERFGSGRPGSERFGSGRPSAERPGSDRFEPARPDFESDRFAAEPWPGEQAGRESYDPERPAPRQRFEPEAYEQAPSRREPLDQEPPFRPAAPLPERRYRRSEEPLDVEPLEDGESLPRGRRDLNDPW